MKISARFDFWADCFLILNNGKLVITPNHAYIGPNKIDLTSDTKYVHPSSKQCNYSYTHPATKQCNYSVPIVNNLTSTSTTSALSAAQGRILNQKVQSGMVWERVRTNYNGYNVFPSTLDYRTVIALAVSASANIVLNKPNGDSEYFWIGYSTYAGGYACTTSAYLSNSTTSGTMKPILVLIDRFNILVSGGYPGSEQYIKFGSVDNGPSGDDINNFYNLSLMSRRGDIPKENVAINNLKCNSWVLRVGDFLNAY